jgi:hypothetical protein
MCRYCATLGRHCDERARPDFQRLRRRCEWIAYAWVQLEQFAIDWAFILSRVHALASAEESVLRRKLRTGILSDYQSTRCQYCSILCFRNDANTILATESALGCSFFNKGLLNRMEPLGCS